MSSRECSPTCLSQGLQGRLASSPGSIFMAESEEELKNLLMKVIEESENVGFKINVQKSKIMASGPITSWEMIGKQWKQ